MYILKEPVDEVYRELVDLACSICDCFILVVNNHEINYLNDNGKQILTRLNDYLIELKVESKWPGGGTTGPPYDVYYYKTTDEAKNILKEAANSLYSWVSPDLPEDLTFLKNGEPWLVNICLDYQSAFMNASKEDMRRILDIVGLEVQ